MSTAKDILHFFARLHWVLETGEVKVTPEPNHATTARIFSDAWNGRISEDIGPKSCPRFVNIWVEWYSLTDEPFWKVRINWSAVGAQSVDDAEEYAQCMDEAINRARLAESIVCEGGTRLRPLPDMDKARDLLDEAWDRTKSAMSDDATPTEIAANVVGTPVNEAEEIIEHLQRRLNAPGMDEKVQLCTQIIRLMEAIEADPDDDELWEQAQQYLR